MAQKWVCAASQIISAPGTKKEYCKLQTDRFIALTTYKNKFNPEKYIKNDNATGLQQRSPMVIKSAAVVSSSLFLVRGTRQKKRHPNNAHK